MIKHPWASLAGYNIPKIYLLSYLHTSLKKILIKHDYDVHEAVTQNCEFRVFCCLIFSVLPTGFQKTLLQLRINEHTHFHI